MRYILKSGNLYKDKNLTVLVKMKSTLIGPLKKIQKSTGELLLEASIRYLDETKAYTGDVRNREYTLIDHEGNLIASAFPKYAEGENPDKDGLSIYRMPRVDHAHITIGGTEYILIMHNSKHYTMKNLNNVEILRILHKGIAGGWILEDSYGFVPEVLCGLFAFCRYIEQENELLIV